jgi:hypothetical protein
MPKRAIAARIEAMMPSCSQVLMPPLEVAAEKKHEHHAHLVRDGSEDLFKIYLFVDCWATISIYKAGGTAVCEGDSKGLSAHGGMFLYCGPAIAKRAAKSTKNIDFTPPPPPLWASFGQIEGTRVLAREP